jgi:redox-sensitive bicupin YhaK (pirin superfamily)
VKVFQDVELYTSVLEPGNFVNYHLWSDRYGWLQIAQGVANLNGQELTAGDGVQITGEEQLKISTSVGTEILLFDLG